MSNRQFSLLESAYFLFGVGGLVMWFTAVALECSWLAIIALVSVLVAMLCAGAVLIWDK